MLFKSISKTILRVMVHFFMKYLFQCSASTSHAIVNFPSYQKNRVLSSDYRKSSANNVSRKKSDKNQIIKRFFLAFRNPIDNLSNYQSSLRHVLLVCSHFGSPPYFPAQYFSSQPQRGKLTN